MTTPTLTMPPDAASRADDADNFADKMDATLAWQVIGWPELATAISWIATTAAQIAADAISASTAAATAAQAANASKWVTGTTYVEGDVRWSPTTWLSYRRKTAGAGSTDPASDTTNWAALTSGGDVTQTGAQTLTNKTLTDPAITGAITEDIYAITDGVAPDINPANGSIQTWTLGASRTPTAGSFAAGKRVTLMINDGSAYTVTWSTIGVVWLGGVAPTLPTSGYAIIVLWKVGSTIYGVHSGNVA